MDAWKKLKLPKVGKGCLKLNFFLWFTHWWNRLCETDWLGVSKDIKEIQKFYKNELRLKFHCYILIPRKCLRKTLFQHTVGGGQLPPKLSRFRRLCQIANSSLKALIACSPFRPLFLEKTFSHVADRDTGIRKPCKTAGLPYFDRQVFTALMQTYFFALNIPHFRIRHIPYSREH